MRSFLSRYSQLWKLIIAALALIPLIEPLSTPLFDKIGFTNLPDIAALGIQSALVILAVGLVLNVWTTYRYARRPLSVIKSEIHLKFDDPLGEKVTTSRKLLLRPEQPGITAKYRSVQETNGGTIDRQSIKEHRVPEVPTDKLLRLGSSKSMLIVQRFKNPLPYSWACQILVPDIICRYLVGFEKPPGRWLGKFLSRENSEMVEFGEYKTRKGEFRVTTSRYSTSDLRIKITFHQANLPTHVEGHSLTALTVEDADIETPMPSDNDCTYSIIFHDLEDKIARVGWKLSKDPVTLDQQPNP